LEQKTCKKVQKFMWAVSSLAYALLNHPMRTTYVCVCLLSGKVASESGPRVSEPVGVQAFSAELVRGARVPGRASAMLNYDARPA
jgi:hypothetical protein